MQLSTQTEKSLLQTGLFKARNSVLSYLLLKMIDEKGEPVGAWQLQEDLLKCNIKCSTASVGRLLRNLDYKEYTIRRSNLGRVLTPSGQIKLAELNEKIANVTLQNSFHKSLQVHKYDELIDLLLARRVLETEATRQAALNRTEADVRRLSQATEAHRQCVISNLDPTETALDFHAIIAEISHNRFLKTLLDMLIHEEKRIESVMESLVTRERGQAYAKEHAAIAEAIIAKDPVRAAKLMEQHIQVLSDAITNQFVSDDIL